MSALKDEPIVEHSAGIVLIRNQNTTIGYCRYFDNGDVEYIFVNSMYRRQGHGTTLLREVEKDWPARPSAPTDFAVGSAIFTAHDVTMQPDADFVQ